MCINTPSPPLLRQVSCHLNQCSHSIEYMASRPSTQVTRRAYSCQSVLCDGTARFGHLIGRSKGSSDFQTTRPVASKLVFRVTRAPLNVSFAEIVKGQVEFEDNLHHPFVEAATSDAVIRRCECSGDYFLHSKMNCGPPINAPLDGVLRSVGQGTCRNEFGAI
ncbi:hypothetical protein BKA93DRAFT_403749 [Sparassis latifolia]